MPGAAAAWAVEAIYGWGVASIGAAAAVSAGAAALYAAAYVAATLAITVGLSKVSSALMGKPKVGGGLASRNIVVRTSISPRTIIYGEARVGGVLVYINTGDVKNARLDFVIAIAGHEITEISDVWFDDVQIANANIGGGAAGGGAVSAGKYKNVAWIYKYLGTDSQTADSTLTARYGSEWTSDHRGRGVAYVHISLKRDNDVYDTGPPANFTFKVKGAKVYDPRKDSTNGGSGSHRIADPSTWEYSNNPALCVADYTIGGSITNSATRVNMRGFGADPNDVSWSSVIAAANICDENVTIPPASPTTTQKRYLCDGALSEGDTPADNLEQLLTSMMGQVTYSSGKYRVFAGAYDTPTLTLNESDLAGTIEYATGTGRADRYNAVKGTRYDLATAQEVEFLPRTSSAYETEDGGVRLYRDITLPFTLDEYRAQRIATMILRRSREQAVLVWRGNLGCLRVGVWETLQVTIAELGLSSKVFRCISRDFNPGSEGGDQPIVQLTLREEFSTTYTDPIVSDYGSLSPATPAATPSDYVDTSDELSVVYDPEFATGEGTTPTYWDTAGTVAWDSAGKVSLTCNGTTAPEVRTKYMRTFLAQVTSAWTVSVTLRYRVSSSLTGSNKRFYVRLYTSGDDYLSGATLCDSKAIDVSSAVVNTWYSQQFTLSYAPSGSYDRVRVRIVAETADLTAGALEIDHCYAVRKAQVGTDGLTVSAVPDARTIACDSGGTPISGQLSYDVTATVYAGATNVTSDCSYSHTTSGCTVTDNGGGSYTVTAVSADSGYLEITATYAGTSAIKRCTFSKALAGAASSSADDNTWSDVTVTSYPATGQGGPIQIPVGPNGTIAVSAYSGEYIGTTNSSGQNTTLTAKIQYREVGTSTWYDVSGASATGGNAYYYAPDSMWLSANFTISQTTMSGPGTAKIYEFQIVIYRSAGNSSTTTYLAYSGTNLHAQWAP